MFEIYILKIFRGKNDLIWRNLLTYAKKPLIISVYMNWCDSCKMI